MTQRQLNDFAQGRGLICMGYTLAGVWDGWPLLAVFRPDRREELYARILYAQGPARGAARHVRLPAGCRLSVGRRELRLRCRAGGEELLDLFRAAMDAAVALLDESGASSEDVCALCGEGDWDSFALVKNRYVPVHRDCCEHLRRRAQANAALNAGGGNYLTGWLGALAGGLTGLLPTALSVWLWGMTSAWLCLLVPLGAYFGYKLCLGRMDRMAVIATVAASLVQVFLLEQMRYYQGFVEQGIFPLVFASMSHYFKNVPLVEMLSHVAQPLEFITLGSVCALCMIDVGNLDRLLACDTVLDSLTQRESAVAAQVRQAWAAESAPTATFIPVSAMHLPAADSPAADAGAPPEEDAPIPKDGKPPEDEPPAETATDGVRPVPVIVEYDTLRPAEGVAAWTAAPAEPPGEEAGRQC